MFTKIIKITIIIIFTKFCSLSLFSIPIIIISLIKRWKCSFNVFLLFVGWSLFFYYILFLLLNFLLFLIFNISLLFSIWLFSLWYPKESVWENIHLFHNVKSIWLQFFSIFEVVFLFSFKSSTFIFFWRFYYYFWKLKNVIIMNGIYYMMIFFLFFYIIIYFFNFIVEK